MATASFLLLIVIFHLSLLSFAEEKTGFIPNCPSLGCGRLGNISFPFSNQTHNECGLLMVDNCDKPDSQKIKLGKHGPSFYISGIAQDNALQLRANVSPDYWQPSDQRICGPFKSFNLTKSPLYSFEFLSKATKYRCLFTNKDRIPKNFHILCHESNYSSIYRKISEYPKDRDSPRPPAGCSVIQSLVTTTSKHVVFHDIYVDWFYLRVNVKKECYDCYWRRGQCLSDSHGKFRCSGANAGNGINPLTLGLGLGIGGSVILIVALSIFIKKRHKKGKYVTPNLHSGNTSSYPSSKSDLEEDNLYLGVPVFSYSELAEATNNFNHDKELGDGGFGTVYHGKLRDGREVAVKRLYEHNYKRVEQFMNEIKILTRLHHKNLVSLYGCTSRSTQGLLLVYEFIPNGTLANHLHGDRAKRCLLTWPIRMNIAIETAIALAYLHASDVIHRDVKTNNILLDNNFFVKVVDFGLSRLFPTDVTHVSTAPQGTPGYVDPEYHQCYQLTDKSDVYSFGVVLTELVSSMPAVDVSRDKYEINLANLAINKIQKCAVDELIDPCLGFHLDEEVKRMATSVAELAFLCLQQTKEMRPSMDAVLEQLVRIKSREYKPENLKEKDDDYKEELKSMQQPQTGLLKNIEMPSSPISVTENWVTNSTTPNVSN